METKSSTNVGGLQFEWDLTEGRFSFEGQDAVLFWTSTAMKQFFDSLEEVSGEEAARVVLETTGFRQGLVVGEYFNNLKDVSVAKAANLITNTYASAGWGLVEIVDLNVQDRTLEVLLKNSWEHKINLAQGKIMGSDFLPAHFAGIFTGLFGCNIWYKVEHYQIEGMDETVISYFPSEKNVEENIHKLARQKEEERIMELEKQVEEKTVELKQVIKDISSPIIPVLEGIVVIPLLGTYDEARARGIARENVAKLAHS